MTEQPSHIDWEKLLTILEKDQQEQLILISDLNEDEKEALVHLQQIRGDKDLLAATQINTKQAWNKLSENLEEQVPVVTMRRSAFGWTRWVAAACFLIIVTGGILFWLNRSTDPSENYTNPAEALANHKPAAKVQLILADGKKFEAENNQHLEEKAGSAIQWGQDIIRYEGNIDSASLLMNTLVVPRGYLQTVTLSDGTRIWMNADSKLRFPVQFNKSERRIELEGEAYLEVKHSSDWPFIVSVANSEVRVLGTSFDVKAYNSKIFTTLVTGRISFKSDGEAPVLLEPDQQLVKNKNGGSPVIRKVAVEQWIAWKDDELIMEDMPFSELAEILERRYDVQMEFADEKLKQIQYDAALDLTKNIVDLLENLEKAANIRFMVKDKTILIQSSHKN